MNATRGPLLALGSALLLALSASPVANAEEGSTAPADDVSTAPAQEHAQQGPAAKRTRRIKVRKIRPRSGKTFVPLDATVRLRFSRPVDLESVNLQTISLRVLGGDEVEWTGSVSKGGKLVVLTPTNFLDPGVDYQVDVRFGVTGLKGERLKKQRTAIFFTDATIPPFQFVRPDQFEKLHSQMFEGRAEHSATQLDDGRVLIVGGTRDGSVISRSADFFDPVDDVFRPVPAQLTSPRAFHPAVPLAGGAMMVGGWNGTTASSTTEIFDPSIVEFREGPSMLEPRDFVDAIVLEDGRVLVVGGLDYVGTSARFSTTAEIYDASAGSFRLTKSGPRDRRAGHKLTMLPDGRVLVSGGQAAGSGGSATAEIFDPRTETFTYTVGPPIGYRQLHTATTLSDGRVLLADGGNGKLELYDPELDRFFEAGGASFVRRTHATASLLPGDRVLLLGGFDQRGDQTLILESMDLYLPNLGGGLGRVVRPDVVLDQARAGHTATTLVGGRVLITGGYGPGGGDSLATALIFKP